MSSSSSSSPPLRSRSPLPSPISNENGSQHSFRETFRETSINNSPFPEDSIALSQPKDPPFPEDSIALSQPKDPTFPEASQPKHQGSQQSYLEDSFRQDSLALSPPKVIDKKVSQLIKEINLYEFNESQHGSFEATLLELAKHFKEIGIVSRNILKDSHQGLLGQLFWDLHVPNASKSDNINRLNRIVRLIFIVMKRLDDVEEDVDDVEEDVDEDPSYHQSQEQDDESSDSDQSDQDDDSSQPMQKKNKLTKSTVAMSTKNKIKITMRTNKPPIITKTKNFVYLGISVRQLKLGYGKCKAHIEAYLRRVNYEWVIYYKLKDPKFHRIYEKAFKSIFQHLLSNNLYTRSDLTYMLKLAERCANGASSSKHDDTDSDQPGLIAVPDKHDDTDSDQPGLSAVPDKHHINDSDQPGLNIGNDSNDDPVPNLITDEDDLLDLPDIINLKIVDSADSANAAAESFSIGRKNQLSKEVYSRFARLNRNKHDCQTLIGVNVFNSLPEMVPFTQRSHNPATDEYVIDEEKTVDMEVTTLFKFDPVKFQSPGEFDMVPCIMAIMLALSRTPASALGNVTPNRSCVKKAFNEYINADSVLWGEEPHKVVKKGKWPVIAKKLWDGKFSEYNADVSTIVVNTCINNLLLYHRCYYLY